MENIINSNIHSIVVKSSNGLFAIDPEDKVVGGQLRNAGQYGIHEIELIKQRLASNSKVLNVGAHIGTLAIHLSKYCKEIVAIEANPYSFELLNINIKLNSVYNINTINIAAGDKDEEIQFLLNRINSGGSKRVPKIKHPTYYYDNPETIRINSVSLDRYLEEIDFDIVVMDIEGSEFFALKGMQDILSNCNSLIVEFLPHHLKNVSGITVEQFLSVIDPHFTRLTIPSKQLVVNSSEFALQMNIMYNLEQEDEAIIFEKV